jgi:hypothetical protein
MGTRSVTKFYEVCKGKERFLGALYRQFDGYLDGHGKELKEFLAGKKVINGISLSEDNSKCFNGIGCLGASTIARFKTEIGGFYLTEENDEEEYNYKIWAKMPDNVFDKPEGIIYIEVKNYDRLLYSGPIDDMPTREDD